MANLQFTFLSIALVVATLLYLIRRHYLSSHMENIVVCPFSFVVVMASLTVASVIISVIIPVISIGIKPLAILFYAFSIICFAATIVLMRYRLILQEDGVTYIPYTGNQRFFTYKTIDYIDCTDKEYAEIYVDGELAGRINKRVRNYKETIKALRKQGVAIKK